MCWFCLFQPRVLDVVIVTSRRHGRFGSTDTASPLAHRCVCLRPPFPLLCLQTLYLLHAREIAFGTAADRCAAASLRSLCPFRPLRCSSCLARSSCLHFVHDPAWIRVFHLESVCAVGPGIVSTWTSVALTLVRIFHPFLPVMVSVSFSRFAL